MRFIWLIFVGLVLAMLGLLPKQPPGVAPKPAGKAESAAQPAEGAGRRPPLAALVMSSSSPGNLVRGMARRDSLVFFAMQQLGTSYCYAGTTPETGFDCSGFVQYVFRRFDVPVPHSTAMLIDVGQPVPREQALPGDIVVFTGTAKTATTPGHAGIIISAGPKGPIRFVHSSSARRESGVKVSQVEGTDYERRFMQVRRVLGLGRPAAARPVTAPAAAPAPASVPVPPVAAPIPAATVPVRAGGKRAATPKKATAVAKKKTARRPAGITRRKAPAKAKPSTAVPRAKAASR